MFLLLFKGNIRLYFVCRAIVRHVKSPKTFSKRVNHILSPVIQKIVEMWEDHTLSSTPGSHAPHANLSLDGALSLGAFTAKWARAHRPSRPLVAAMKYVLAGT